MESDNFTIRHNKRKPRGQPFPAGDHKAAINKRTRKHNKNKTEITYLNDSQKKNCIRKVSKTIILEDLNLVSQRANLTLSSDLFTQIRL